MKSKLRKLSVFLSLAALTAFLIFLIVLSVSAHFVTVHEGYENYPMNELVIFWRDQPLLSLAATAAAIALCMFLHMLLEKYQKYHLQKLLCIGWLLFAFFWLWGAGLVPRADSKYVINAAREFAIGDYSALSTPYFNNCSYQLGFCLLLEMILRAFPAVNLPLLGQLVNALLCCGMVFIMERMYAEMTGRRTHAVAAMYLLFLPMPFYCTYVYSTIPMMFCIALSFWLYARYIRRGFSRDGWLFAAAISTAALLKPNAMIPLAALCIISILYALRGEHKKLLLYCFSAVILSLALPRLAALQYELRSGIRLSGDISMLARLVMGFQRSPTGAGWYNNYVNRFSTVFISPQDARPILLSDLSAQFSAFAQEPLSFVRFMSEKCASLWLEPTYSVLWHGVVTEVSGRFNGLVNMLYLDTGAWRMPVERLMDALQQAMYVLSCIGTIDHLRHKREPLYILLPVFMLGGFLYHALFEVKSQYAFVYAFFMIPLAVHGLTTLETYIRALRKKQAR